MFVCKAPGCLSNQDTKVTGREITFFAFPEDDTRRKQWFENSKLTSVIDKEPLYLCELHFDNMSFTESRELKPDAVPTVFENIDNHQRKHKVDNSFQTEPSIVPPLKQKKLDEDSHSLVTPPQSPCAQSAEDENERIKEDKSQEEELALDASHKETTLCTQISKKIYRLTVQIDKIRGKPCPRSKKFASLTLNVKESQSMQTNGIQNNQQDLSPCKISKTAPCIRGTCKLRKCFYDSRPAFQCEHCDKYYVTKKTEGQNTEKTNSNINNTCTVCQKVFSSPQSMYLHIKKHFVCDMCQTECGSQVSYDKHARLHVSTDPLYPYKCHQCSEIFELKEDAKQHYLIMHPTIQLQNTILRMTASPLTSQLPHQADFRCVSCNITFRNEQAYRNHINSHRKKEGLRCGINDANNVIPVPNPLTGSQIGILRAVKFSCRVCSKEFDNVGEVDQHTRTHLEDADEEQKCNICQKSFKTNALLNEHLKHHLSRAHPCPLCPKAFINRTTLKIHLKSHSET